MVSTVSQKLEKSCINAFITSEWVHKRYHQTQEYMIVFWKVRVGLVFKARDNKEEVSFKY